MASIRGLLLALGFGLAAGPAAAAPLEAYGRLPSIEAVAISPDGAKLVITRTAEDRRQIAIQDVATGQTIQGLEIGDAKVRAVQWAGPSHIIITTSKTAKLQDVSAPRAEYFMAFDYNLDTRKLYPLLRDAQRSLPTIFEIPTTRILNGKPVLFVQGIHFNSSGQGALGIFRIELGPDSSTLVDAGTTETRDWLVGADGAPLAQTTYDGRGGRWALKLKAGAGWRESRVIEAPVESPVIVGLGRDGRSVLMKELLDGAAQVREVSPEGVWGDPLGIAEGEGAIFDPARHNLIGYNSLVGEEDRYNFLDPQDQASWQVVQKAFPGQRVRLISWSETRQKIVVGVDSPVEGPGYALVDLATHKANWLGASYDKLEAQDISPVRTVGYKAQDGMGLTGYLTLPRGLEAKGLPLVVFPHGGPAVRDEPGFNWWAQAMASRGYAVLQVNFRGSNGFGWRFLQAGFGQWGRKMQTDLSDGVRELARQGVVDPKRVCIVGASYGGYAAMAGPTLDPGVYRCAAAVAGISDLRRFAPWVREQNGAGSQRYLIRFLGAESIRDASLSEISPVAHIDRVNVPMLLVHGKDDTVVPLEQSRIMADALKAAGKPVEFVVLDGADHWLTRGDTRLATLYAVIGFIEKNNPPR